MLSVSASAFAFSFLFVLLLPVSHAQDCNIPIGQLLGYSLLSSPISLYDGVCSELFTQTCCTEEILESLNDEVDDLILTYEELAEDIPNSMVVIYDKYAKMIDNYDPGLDLEDIFDPTDYDKDVLLYDFATTQESCFLTHFEHTASTFCYGCDANYEDYQSYLDISDTVYMLIDSEACWSIVETCTEYLDYVNLAASMSLAQDSYLSENNPNYVALSSVQIELLEEDTFGYCGWADANGIVVSTALERQEVLVEMADKLATSSKIISRTLVEIVENQAKLAENQRNPEGNQSNTGHHDLKWENLSAEITESFDGKEAEEMHGPTNMAKKLADAKTKETEAKREEIIEKELRKSDSTKRGSSKSGKLVPVISAHPNEQNESLRVDLNDARTLQAIDSNHYLFYYKSNIVHPYPNTVDDYLSSEMDIYVAAVSFGGLLGLELLNFLAVWALLGLYLG